MAHSATRFASTLAALLLGSTAICGSAHAGWFDLGSKKEAAATESKSTDTRSAVVKSDEVKPAETLDGSIEQARSLRLAGNYQEAIRHLSQLMIVASDDGRVVSEYGKALVETGRAQEAINFLTRAEQLRPADWTVFSAQGVAQDQLGNQKAAQIAYERALTLRPEEVSVLNNYALSRMLAKDTEAARKLVARAEAAGGAADTKIARNIAMIRDMAPATQDVAAASHDMAPPVAAPKPASVASLALPPAQPAPVAEAKPAPVAEAKPVPAAPVLAAPAAKETKPSQVVATAAPLVPSGVVMQRVPVDPLAGPVAATKPPRSLAANPAPVADTAAKSSAPALKPAVPVKAADAKPAVATETKPIAVKAAEAKPAPVKTADSKATPAPEAAPAPVKAAEAKPAADIKAASVKTAEPAANAKTIPIKAADVKPITEVKPVKAAEAKPAPAADTKPALVKAAAKDEAAKPGVPSLRMSANAY